MKMDRLLQRLLACGLFAAAAGLLIAAGLPSRTGIAPQPDAALGVVVAAEVGAQAPLIEGVGLHGERLSLAAWRGRPVIINFWATWCLPCIKELPLLERFAAEHPTIAVLTINVNEDPALVAAWLQANQIGLTTGLNTGLKTIIDRDGRWVYTYQVQNLPRTFFLDAKGIIRMIVEGEIGAAQLAAGLEQSERSQ